MFTFTAATKERRVPICTLITCHGNLLCHSEVTTRELMNYYYSYYCSCEMSSKLWTRYFSTCRKTTDKELYAFPEAVLTKAVAKLIPAHGTLLYVGLGRQSNIWNITYGQFGPTNFSVFTSTCQIILMSNTSCPAWKPMQVLTQYNLWRMQERNLFKSGNLIQCVKWRGNKKKNLILLLKLI